jgi:hypothetical protein
MNTPSGHRPLPPPAPVLGCRLCVVAIGDAESAWCEPAIDTVIGPSFLGTPVLASDGTDLVVIGRDADVAGHAGRTTSGARVWRGQPGALVQVGTIDVDLRLDCLVHHGTHWHLYGADADDRAWHGTSDDLTTWTTDEHFSTEHPHLVVRGAASMPHAVVVLGEVIAHGRRMGWTLLEGAIGPYHAREVTFPLTAGHDVVGPVGVGDDEMALLVSSGASHVVARTVAGTNSRSWTLALLAPDMVPVAAFAHLGATWVVGADAVAAAPLLAVVGGRAFHLDRADGDVRAGAVHRDRLVLARVPPVDGDAFGTQPAAAVDQSSPAYIDSISAA